MRHTFRDIALLQLAVGGFLVSIGEPAFAGDAPFLSGGTQCEEISGKYEFIGDNLTDLRYVVARMDRLLFLKEIQEEVTWGELSVDLSRAEMRGIFYLDSASKNRYVEYAVTIQCVNNRVTYDVTHDGYSDGSEHKTTQHVELTANHVGDLSATSKIIIKSTDFFIFSRNKIVNLKAIFKRIKINEN